MRLNFQYDENIRNHIEKNNWQDEITKMKSIDILGIRKYYAVSRFYREYKNGIFIYFTGEIWILFENDHFITSTNSKLVKLVNAYIFL